MVFRKTVIKYAKKAGKVVKKAAKGRYAPKGKINYAKIAQDAAKLVKLMNVEKKYITHTNNAFAFAQTSFASFTITPGIAQGITGNTRNGNSLKLVSARADFQIKTQASTVNAFKYKYYIINSPQHTGTTSLNATNQFLDSNIFSGVVDYHSQRDPEFFKNYKVICSGGGTIMPEQLAGQTGIVQFHRNLKLNHHLKYDIDGTTVPTMNEFYLIVVADSGDTSLLTGAVMDFTWRVWYVDN